MFALFIFFCPPAWFYFSLPLESQICRAPIIKFICHFVSHIYFTLILIIVVLNITHKIYDITSIIPSFAEWILLIWLSGNLISELSIVSRSSGFGIVKVFLFLLNNLFYIIKKNIDYYFNFGSNCNCNSYISIFNTSYLL